MNHSYVYFIDYIYIMLRITTTHILCVLDSFVELYKQVPKKFHINLDDFVRMTVEGDPLDKTYCLVFLWEVAKSAPQVSKQLRSLHHINLFCEPCKCRSIRLSMRYMYEVPCYRDIALWRVQYYFSWQ